MCTSILKEKSEICIFDSHSRNELGQIEPDGSAGLFKFTSISHVGRYLQVIAAKTCDNNTQIDMHPVTVQIMHSTRKGDVLQLSNDDSALSTRITYRDAQPETDYSSGSTRIRKRDHKLDTDKLDTDNSLGSNKERGSQPDDINMKGLTLRKILHMSLSAESEKILQVLPKPKANSIFMIDLNCVDEKDVSCDNSGIYKTHSSPTTVVRLKSDGSIDVLARSNPEEVDNIETDPNIYTIKRLYSYMKHGALTLGRRIISKIHNRGKINNIVRKGVIPCKS